MPQDECQAEREMLELEEWLAILKNREMIMFHWAWAN
jgi:hypothetical protein